MLAYTKISQETLRDVDELGVFGVQPPMMPLMLQVAPWGFSTQPAALQVLSLPFYMAVHIQNASPCWV